MTSSTLEDPIVAALPPATDYITYLTLLEYQLTPQNLPTLNRLLLADDGTLASEIGWDLLQLVLPILRIKPHPANECLDIIAKRGNPREVIVRVAEELEKLGVADDDDEAEDVETEGDDELPTFAGEAPRVHLGDMKLDGMPSQEEKTNEAKEPVAQEATNEVNHDADIIKFSSLVSMIPSLQSRIKTQHPSRFLATSLPAVLGAYRRLKMSGETTNAVLLVLGKLGGRQRPALPPRTSTAGSIPRTAIQQTATSQAPLPDPEAKPTEDTKSTTVSDNDKAISHKLLQAVLLEVLDDYTASLSGEELLSSHVRAYFEPQSMPSSRLRAIEKEGRDQAWVERQDVFSKVAKLAKELKLDVNREVVSLAKPEVRESKDVEEPENEYPTTPSQIPFSSISLILLYAHTQFLSATTDQTTSNSTESLLNLEATLSLLANTMISEPRLSTTPILIDAMISILDTSLHTSENPSNPPSTLPQIHTYLVTVLTTAPSPGLRDNAYHLLATLFHTLTPNSLKVPLLRTMLTPPSSNEPLLATSSPSLAASAMTLLKDSLYPTTHTRQLFEHDALANEERLTPEDARSLTSLLFQRRTAEDSGQGDYVEASQLPCYIAALNLLTLLCRDERVAHEELGVEVNDFVVYVERLKARLMQTALERKGDETEIEVDVADVFALEDVLGRVKLATEGVEGWS